jgi:hypothetical protein
MSRYTLFLIGVFWIRPGHADELKLKWKVTEDADHILIATHALQAKIDKKGTATGKTANVCSTRTWRTPTL